MPLPATRERAGFAFEDLYRSSRDDVYAYVATLLRDPIAAEDVTAQAFERAYRKRKSFRRDRGSERAWLFGIARNAALDELRRARRLAPSWSSRQRRVSRMPRMPSTPSAAWPCGAPSRSFLGATVS